jgi:hypothetical protein
VHGVELEVLAFNRRAINCYLACGFRQEGVRREACLYPDGWKDVILMGLLRSEYAAQRGASDNADADAGSGWPASQRNPSASSWRTRRADRGFASPSAAAREARYVPATRPIRTALAAYVPALT